MTATSPHDLRRSVCHPLTADMLKPLPPEAIVVQVEGTLTDAEYAQVNELLRRRPDVTLRVFTYSGDSSPTDVDFLRHLPDLRALQVGWPDLTDLRGLAAVAPNLVSLTLEATRGACSLEPVRHLTALESFGCGPSYTDLDVLTELPALRELSLSRPDVAELPRASFQGSIQALSLYGLGRQTVLTLSDDMSGLRFLEVKRSNRLVDISAVARLSRLECLALDHLPALAELPDLAGLRTLDRLEIFACRRLADLRPLRSAPALRTVVLSQVPLGAADVAFLAGVPTLRAATLDLSRRTETRAAEEFLRLPPATGTSPWRIPRVRRSAEEP